MQNTYVIIHRCAGVIDRLDLTRSGWCYSCLRWREIDNACAGVSMAGPGGALHLHARADRRTSLTAVIVDL